MATSALLSSSLVHSVMGGQGTIRIAPSLPVMLNSPATFTIWAQPGGNPTYDPHILLVMTENCYNGLQGDVVVEWSGGSIPFSQAEFIGPVDIPEIVPPTGTTPGSKYTVASLKDHLGTDMPVYWAMDAFLSGPIVTSPAQTFEVTLPSTNPRMLVYALGKTKGSDLFNNKVPPTIPGFVIPELIPILLVLAPFGALVVSAFIHMRSPNRKTKS